MKDAANTEILRLNIYLVCGGNRSLVSRYDRW